MDALLTAVKIADLKDMLYLPDHVAIVYDYIFSNFHDFENAVGEYRVCFLNVGYSYSSCIIARFSKVRFSFCFKMIH